MTIEALLYQHEDGQHAVSFVDPAPFSNGKPKWHRVGPVAVHGEQPAAWLPIRSAPRDGTHILVRMPEVSDTCYVVCWANAREGIRAELGSAVQGWHIAWDGTPLETWEPKVWMHLPHYSA